FEVDPRQRGGNALFAFARGYAHELGRVAQIVGRTQLVIETNLVRQIADAALDRERLAHRVTAGHPRLAAGNVAQAEQHEDGRRLAGAVRAKQSEYFARGNA